MENKEIYPSQLTLADTTPPVATDPVHFLGMDIVGDDDRFRLSVYDKRDDFAFPVRRYPQVASLIPHTIPYGVFLGQLHRGYRICTVAVDFMTFAVDVARRLVSNGCGSRRLNSLFATFVRRVVIKWHNRRELWMNFRMMTRDLSVRPSL